MRHSGALAWYPKTYAEILPAIVYEIADAVRDKDFDAAAVGADADTTLCAVPMPEPLRKQIAKISAEALQVKAPAAKKDGSEVSVRRRMGKPILKVQRVLHRVSKCCEECPCDQTRPRRHILQATVEALLAACLLLQILDTPLSSAPQSPRSVDRPEQRTLLRSTTQ